MLKPIHTRILLILITLFSFGLCVWGLQHGLPFEYHPDEQQYILPALDVVSGNFEPQAYHNPSLFPYLIGVVYTLTYLGMRLFNTFPDFFNLNAGWSQDMQPWVSGIIYLARYLSVAAGVLTTLLVYQLGRQAYNQTTGLGAALIFGLTFLPSREAHFAVSDAPVALATTTTLYFCLKIVKRGHWTDYLWTGVMFGLATATKYTAGLLIFPIITAHLLSRQYHNWGERFFTIWRVIITGAIGVLTFLLASPYTLLKHDIFWQHFSSDLQSGQMGFLGIELDPINGAAFYLRGLIWGTGWPIFLLFWGAILLAVWRRQRADLVLLSLPVVIFIYMQRQEMYFVRFLMPLIPPMCVLAAETIQFIVAWILKKQTQLNWSAPTICLAIILLLTLPSTFTAIRADYIFSQPDTRTQALEWIGQNIPPGSQLAVKALTPPWSPPLVMPGLNIGPYNFAQVPNSGVADVEMQQFHDWQVDYIIATSFYYAQPLRDKTYRAQREARMQALDEQAELVALFNPYLRDPGFFYHDQVYGPANDVLYRKQPGPIIKIYRLP